MNYLVHDLTKEELENLKEAIEVRELQIKYDDLCIECKTLEKEIENLNNLALVAKKLVGISKTATKDLKEILENVIAYGGLKEAGWVELVEENEKYYNKFKEKEKEVNNFIEQILKYYE
jgi:streptomycin 6-kinase